MFIVNTKVCKSGSNDVNCKNDFSNIPNILRCIQTNFNILIVGRDYWKLMFPLIPSYYIIPNLGFTLPSGITVWTYLNKQYPGRAKRYLGIFSPIYPYIFFQSLGLIHCGPTLRPRFIIFCLKKAWESTNFKQLKMF